MDYPSTGTRSAAKPWKEIDYISNGAGSTVPRGKLGRLLHEQREAAGASMKSAYECLECSYQRLWRMETGEPNVTLKKPEIESLARFYGMSPEVTDLALALGQAAKEEGWWQNYRGALHRWSELYVGLESAARRIRQFESALIPGLLQAPAYSEAVFRAERPEMPEESLAPRIQIKQERQRLIRRFAPPPPSYEALISEGALLADLDIPGAMQQQLHHLLMASSLSNVSIRVLPLSVGPHPASATGAFAILEFPPLTGNRGGEPTTVYSENLTGALYLDKTEEIEAYEEVWAATTGLALTDKDSTEMITELLKSLGGTPS
jgi:Domain of unknown function (DUF5753)/Helix-turn-helix domain